MNFSFEKDFYKRQFKIQKKKMSNFYNKNFSNFIVDVRIIFLKT